MYSVKTSIEHLSMFFLRENKENEERSCEEGKGEEKGTDCERRLMELHNADEFSSFLFFSFLLSESIEI